MWVAKEKTGSIWVWSKKPIRLKTRNHITNKTIYYSWSVNFNGKNGFCNMLHSDSYKLFYNLSRGNSPRYVNMKCSLKMLKKFRNDFSTIANGIKL